MSELTVGKPGEHEKVTPTPEQNEGYILLDNKVDDDFASRFATDNQKSKEKLKEDSDDDVPDIEVPMLVSQKIEDTGLTFRSIIVGCLIGILVAAMNVNFGLRTGWTQGGSIFAAIIAIAIFRVLQPVNQYTAKEAVITTTAASAAGTMTSAAGLVSSIPALRLLGHQYNVGELYLWALSVAYFGVYFAVPMRKQMIEVEKLVFPSGTATAKTIEAMFATGGDDTVSKAKVLTIWGIGCGIWAVVTFFIPYLEEPPMPKFLSMWGWNLYFNPLLLGGGMLSGMRACASLLLGAIVGWAVLGPIVHYNKWVTGDIMDYNGVRGWILWIGVAVMTCDSLVQLLFSVKMIFGGLISVAKAIVRRPKSISLSNKSPYLPAWVPILGLIISTILLIFVGHFLFDMKWYFILLAIPLSALLCVVATRCAGETDINPVGGMGKVTQLVFAGVARNQVTTNILSAGVVAAGASQCGDMMQDLKTGYMLQVAPKYQFYSQGIGILAGIIFCIPIYKLFDMAYNVGGDKLPAPAAHAWKAVAVILSKGLHDLSKSIQWGILGGAILGVVLGIINKIVSFCKPGWVSYLPSALAFGIGFIVPPKQSLTMFMGAVASQIWKWGWKKNNERYFYAVSSGMIAGEGLMGIFVAILKLLGVKPLVGS